MTDKNANKMWGGRFAAGPSAIMQDINASIGFDRKLWAQDIAGSWLFPLFETIHVFSLVAVLGAIAIVDWRLIGFASRGHSVTLLSRQALPWTSNRMSEPGS